MNDSMAWRGNGKHEMGRVVFEDTVLGSEVDSGGSRAAFPPGHQGGGQEAWCGTLKDDSK